MRRRYRQNRGPRTCRTVVPAGAVSGCSFASRDRCVTSSTMPMVKLLLRIVALFHVAVNSDDVSRLRILGAEAVTTGENLSTAELRAVDSSQNVKVQRLADGARLLRSVEHGDRLNGFRKHVKQVLCNERSVKVNLNKANLLAGCIRGNRSPLRWSHRQSP